MDAPRTQFATTVDGLAIAYAVHGSGPYLVAVPSPPDNHIELEWADPQRRATIAHMGRYRSVVRFDARGTGASDRQVDGFSLEARLLDMEAVLGQLGNPPVALLTGGHGSQLAVAYAAAHPDLVTHMILVNPFVRGEQFMERSHLEMWRQMLQTDYAMFTGALGAEIFGWGREEGAHFSEYFRHCVTADMTIIAYNAMIEVDLAEMEMKLAMKPSPMTIEEDDDLFGHSVIAAARLVARAEGAEVLVSDVVRQLDEPGHKSILSADYAIQHTEIIFATYESSRRRGRVNFPLEADDNALIQMFDSGLIGPLARK